MFEDCLLKNKTTGKNIIFATDNYTEYGYNFNDELTLDFVKSPLLKHRFAKRKEDQQERSRKRAEVFTPSWICNKQINLVDSDVFKKENLFNTEIEKTWRTVETKVNFEDPQKDWKFYVKRIWLEITCGEAPYITSRYDSVNGTLIPVKNRIGILDRKLRVISENVENVAEWVSYAIEALKSTYGYEWSGDSLFIARYNILKSVLEHFHDKFEEKAKLLKDELETFVEIVVCNLVQMDGLKYTVPGTEIPVRVVDWEENKVINFRSIKA